MYTSSSRGSLATNAAGPIDFLDLTLLIPSNDVYVLSLAVTAKSNADVALWNEQWLISDSAVVGNHLARSPRKSSGASAWDVEIAIVGSDIIVAVTGSATPIVWTGSLTLTTSETPGIFSEKQMQFSFSCGSLVALSDRYLAPAAGNAVAASATGRGILMAVPGTFVRSLVFQTLGIASLAENQYYMETSLGGSGLDMIMLDTVANQSTESNPFHVVAGERVFARCSSVIATPTATNIAMSVLFVPD